MDLDDGLWKKEVFVDALKNHCNGFIEKLFYTGRTHRKNRGGQVEYNK